MGKDANFKIRVFVIILLIMIIILTVTLIVAINKINELSCKTCNFLEKENLKVGNIKEGIVEFEITEDSTENEVVEIGSYYYDVVLDLYNNDGEYFNIEASEELEEIEIDGEKISASKIINDDYMEEVKKVLSKNQLDRFLGETETEENAFKIVRKVEDNYYILGVDRGADLSYIKSGDLELKEREENKITFNVKTYYFTESFMESKIFEENNDINYDALQIDPAQYIESLGYKSEDALEIKENEFSLIKEDGVWKVDFFVMPY